MRLPKISKNLRFPASCAGAFHKKRKAGDSVKITTNPDKEYAAKIREKLKENGGYCPCRISKTNDTKCICKEFQKQIEQEIEGYCHCKLYKVEKV